MDWFNILKNPDLVQGQRQGMKPIDIQKPFKRVKEDDKDCYDEFVRIYEKTKNSFPNAEKTEKGIRVPGRKVLSDIFYYDEFEIRFASKIPQKGKIPDEVFCEVIKLYKSIEDESSGMVFENHYIEAYKDDRVHYIAIWEGDYAAGLADAYIILEEFSKTEVIGFGYGSLKQNIDGWKGSFI